MQLTTIPLEDGFETTLSQSYDGEIGTIFVNNTPSFTFPVGETTYGVVNPTNSLIQIVEIDDYDPVLGTFSVSNITLEKGAGVNSTPQDHPVNSTLIISDNYQFWKNIKDAINSKVGKDEDNDIDTGKITLSSVLIAQLQFQNLTTTERTTLGGLLGATDNVIVKDTTDGEHYKWNGSAWDVISAGSTQPNGSETVAGKFQLATNTEQGLGTSVGTSGARLIVANDQLVKVSSGAGDENKVGVLNDDGLYDDFITAESEDVPGLVQIATAAEVIARTNTVKSLTPATFSEGMKSTVQARTVLTSGVTYQATANGFVHGVATTPSSNNFGTVNVVSDANATPTTLVAAAGGNSNGGYSYCVPILKDHYYKATISITGSGTANAYFTALN